MASSRPSTYEILGPKRIGGYTIQGSKATNLEYYVALALEKLGIPFLFQYELAGGRVQRGGIILDFLAITPPLSTPIEVQGEFWHRSNQTTEDKLKEAMLRTYGNFAEIVYLWGAELQSESQALSTVRRELRV